jgi:hypothetical protein
MKRLAFVVLRREWRELLEGRLSVTREDDRVEQRV